MKITKLTTYIVPPRWLFLKMETDEGIVGWGEPVVEGRALTVEAAVHELSDYLVGKDPLLIEDHWQVMYRGGFYRGGSVHMSAIAGIDQALWDIKGKAYGQPIHALLGGQVRDKIKVYSAGSAATAPPMSPTMPARSSPAASRRSSSTAAEEMQIVDSWDKIEKAVETVAIVREAIGPACRHRRRFPWPRAPADGQGARKGAPAL
jgi:galactonate dehydratase